MKAYNLSKHNILIPIILIAIVLGALYYLIQNSERVQVWNNKKAPAGGINESAFIDINGTKQWINIYGKDKNAPVLLYLHGGPCDFTSWYDWEILRKLSSEYIVVNWDQRGCGHNFPEYVVNSQLNAETMLQDGKEMTDELCRRFGKDRITLFGHSWGSIFAANLALDEEYKEKYDALIVASLVVEPIESRTKWKEYLLNHIDDDAPYYRFVEEFDPTDLSKKAFDKLYPYKTKLNKYCDVDNTPNEMYDWIKYNPNWDNKKQLLEAYKSDCEFTNANKFGTIYAKQMDELTVGADQMEQQMSILGRTEYSMPFYLIEGDKDHKPDTMFEVAIEYYNHVDAPDKYLHIINGGGHSSPMLDAEELARFICEVTERINR